MERGALVNADFISALILAGADSDWREGMAYSPLTLAILHGTLNAVQVLVHSGADVSSDADGHACSGLCLTAVARGSTDIIETLLDGGRRETASKWHSVSTTSTLRRDLSGRSGTARMNQLSSKRSWPWQRMI